MKNAYKITECNNWKHSEDTYIDAENHSEAIKKHTIKNVKRIFNKRYREIETTGNYFYVEDVSKNGKCLIFEVIN
jgi:CelD/BcsL family acetyltransferase involved in cellulose biosynthesis